VTRCERGSHNGVDNSVCGPAGVNHFAAPALISRSGNSPMRSTILMNFVSALGRLQRAYTATAGRSVAHVGVSLALARPLISIGRLGTGVRSGVVAESIGFELASLVRSIEHLVQAGFVERRGDPRDRRARTLHLTEAGHAAFEEIESALDKLRAELFSDIPDEDIEAALRVFHALSHRFKCELPELPAKAKQRKR
jgi:MarR family transcriptional regulator for hemolysin